ncbi:alpha/beta hydrolase [Larkinella insperata]|uniref:Alpha/beta hydrolase n=1 Tax=Larkinella insperata TaxID=332158 RepID=A0ABW3QL27_9BACT
MKTRLWRFAACFLFWTWNAHAQNFQKLYSDAIPNALPGLNQEISTANELVDSLTSNVSIPELATFLPSRSAATGTAVIICPGGGYGTLLIKREGTDVAKAFTQLGIAAFVLKYRLPSSTSMKEPSIGPVQDAQQAIKTVRERAAELGINPEKIGIMGFSAGGHLASTAGTHFNTRYIDETGKTSLRPDFMILVNPVVSFNDSKGHIGSRDKLLGKQANAETIRLFSNELQVGKSTPPAFLVHSGTDTVVPVSNSIKFYEALKRNGVNGALHIYAKGEHGFLTYPTFEEWFGRCIEWLNSSGYR